MKKNIVIVLGLIILLASVLRLWNIGNVPPSPDWDEAALSYNAYSLIQTGRDEYGKFMPIVLQSFDDYKPALYMYLATPFIALFGMQTFAIRLPSAILGILTVLATYFVVKMLFDGYKSKQKKLHNYSEIVALLSAFLLAISPWHIQFSRIAFESNVGLAFNVFGILFFLKGLKRPWLLLGATFFWGLSLSVYQSERLFTPLLALSLIIIYSRDLFKIPKKQLITATLVGVIVASPLVFYTLTGKDVFARAKGVSIFNQQTEQLTYENHRLHEDTVNSNILGKIIHNRRVVYFQEMAGGYLSHFDLNWLFITGDEPRHHAPGMGLLYLWELPFLFIGMYLLIFSAFSKKTKLLIFSWMLLAPIPASFTSGVPHAVRTLNFLPTFQILIAIGIIGFYQFINQRLIKKILIKKILYILIVIFGSVNFVYYINQYFVQQNYYYSSQWQYGYEQAVAEVEKNVKQYDSIIVSDVTPLDQSYIFFLYYTKYPPALYQGSRTVKGNRNFDKYIFRKIDWANDKKLHNSLFIGRPQDFPSNIKALKTIYYLDGKPAIKMVSTK